MRTLNPVFDMPNEAIALYFLVKETGPITPAELAVLFKRHISTVYRVSKLLSDAGHITTTYERLARTGPIARLRVVATDLEIAA